MARPERVEAGRHTYSYDDLKDPGEVMGISNFIIAIDDPDGRPRPVTDKRTNGQWVYMTYRAEGPAKEGLARVQMAGFSAAYLRTRVEAAEAEAEDGSTKPELQSKERPAPLTPVPPLGEGYTVTVDDSELVTILTEIVLEMSRQERIHAGGFDRSRDGVRLGIAAISDELRESLEAWHVEKRDDGWSLTREELVQVAAVALRVLRGMA